VVVVPIVAPILLADPGANITAVWLGVMIGLNIQTSFLTPPFGFALFYLRGVAPAIVRTVQIYKGVIPFIVLQLVALAIVGGFPPLVNYLPSRVSFLSETSPPPRNPKLQICLEDYVSEQIAASSAVTDAVAAAKALDLSVLPKELAGDVEDGVASAAKALTALDEVHAAKAAVMAASTEYRPHLTEVRDLEKRIRSVQAEIDALTTQISRMDEGPARDARSAELEEWEVERSALDARKPADWDGVHTTFTALTQAEDKARSAYQRAADEAYDGPAEVLAVLAAGEAFGALETPLIDIGAVFATGSGDEAVDRIKDLESMVGEVDGAGDVKSLLSKARRALDKDKREEALALYDEAMAEYGTQADWRTKAAVLVPGLTAYLDAIRPNLGARVQDRLTREQALAMAACTSHHRDVSLNF